MARIVPRSLLWELKESRVFVSILVTAHSSDTYPVTLLGTVEEIMIGAVLVDARIACESSIWRFRSIATDRIAAVAAPGGRILWQR